MTIDCVIAINKLNGFAKDGDIPWNCKEDLKWFKDVTANSVCLMGRKTYESLYKRSKNDIDILPGRKSIVISKSLDKPPPGVVSVAESIEDGIKEGYQLIKQNPTLRKISIIGGCETIYQSLDYIDTFYLSVINDMTFCDTYFDVYKVVDKFQFVTSFPLNDCATLFLFKNYFTSKIKMQKKFFDSVQLYYPSK